ncbi:MAG: hypothetical protein KA712_11645 [Myxococcales bacterium]|nr:hypothetical protein [Myxococcales bacterium]
MELKRTLLAGVFGLVALNILTAFGAVGLLVRMSPVIEKILSENVASLEAVERMFEALALVDPVADVGASRDSFDRALRAAWANVTEPEERPALTRIEQKKVGAFAGDAEARREVVLALETLSAINRRAMRAADDEAKRLGQAGAWFAVILALLSLVASTFLARRLTRKLLEPLDQLYQVLESFRTGERHRRCTSARVPPEFRAIFDSVNGLLDEQGQPRKLI